MGRQGCNTPSDLHLKHLNQHLKGSFMQLHSHVTNNKQVDIIMLYISSMLFGQLKLYRTSTGKTNVTH